MHCADSPATLSNRVDNAEVKVHPYIPVMSASDIPSRKQEHVNLVVHDNVGFTGKTAGFERYEIEYNALPEIDLDDIATTTTFLDRRLAMPVMISGMTGGYADAERINANLAEAAQHIGIPICVGSMRQALEDVTHHASFTTVRAHAPSVPVLANIGAAQIRRSTSDRGVTNALRAIDLLQADACTVHINALQELVQAEGEPTFAGVLDGIADLVKASPVPVIVKEVGAGISAHVAQRLLDVGVRIIDVAGAGGTSWAGVEILRHPNAARVAHLWNVGIPTVDCLRACRELQQQTPFTLIASGGVTSGTDVAIALALGAHLAASARPFMKAVMEGGTAAVVDVLRTWELHLRQWMFLSGSPTIDALRRAPLRTL